MFGVVIVDVDLLARNIESKEPGCVGTLNRAL